MTLLPRVVDLSPVGLVYLVDDDAAVRRSLELLLGAVGYRVSSHDSAQSLLAVVDDAAHGCIVADIRLVGASGLALAAELGRRQCALPVIFISGHADVPMTVQAFKLGAVDLLQKPIHEQSLLDAISRALAQDAEARQLREASSERAVRLARLTERERGVLHGLANGLTNRELAARWGVSTRTVESHRATLFDKLEVQHLLQLAPYASQVQESTPS